MYTHIQGGTKIGLNSCEYRKHRIYYLLIIILFSTATAVNLLFSYHVCVCVCFVQQRFTSNLGKTEAKKIEALCCCCPLLVPKGKYTL